ncbi:MAG: hypothetical protein WBQ21_06890 [Solirubrobacteraceae bacterium]
MTTGNANPAGNRRRESPSRVPRGIIRATWALALSLAALAVLAPAALAISNYQIDKNEPALVARAETEAKVITAHIGVHLTGLRLLVGWTKYEQLNPYAVTAIVKEEDGDLDPSGGHVCQISVNKSWFSSFSHYEENEVLAHEVFHCFEAEITRRDLHAWVDEGLARWVDLTLFPQTHLKEALGSLTQYYNNPQRPLFQRSYDAVGFWAHVQDKTHDLWSKIPDIIRTDAYVSDASAERVAVGGGASQEAVLTDWGSSAFDLQEDPTPTWRTSSPLDGRYFPSAHAPDQIDTSSTYDLKSFATLQAEIEDNSSLPRVTIHWGPGIHGTFGVGEDLQNSEVTSKTFCAAGSLKQCECPEGDTGSAPVPAMTLLPSQPLLGAASDAVGGQIEITFSGIGECKPPLPPAEQLLPPRSCLNIFPGLHFEIGKPFEVEAEGVEPDGTFYSNCGVLSMTIEKTVTEGPETGDKYNVGLGATVTFTRFPSDKQAIEFMQSVRPPGAATVLAGQEAFMTLTQDEKEPPHYSPECEGEAFVRVDNTVAALAPYAASTEEVCEDSRIQQLLMEAAGSL